MQVGELIQMLWGKDWYAEVKLTTSVEIKSAPEFKITDTYPVDDNRVLWVEITQRKRRG